jgi:hypothetical protein
MPVAPVVLSVFLALLCASGATLTLQSRLGEHHRSRETADHIRLIISILVTFTAVVLGLILSEVKSSYDLFDTRLRDYTGDITQVDMRLRQYGPEAEPIRAKLRTYLAAAIADTWRNEPAPPGDYPKFAAIPGVERQQFGDMLIQVDSAIRRLAPTDAYHARLETRLEGRMADALDRRRLVIETARDTIAWPLLTAMTGWLVIVFGVFGLIAPRNLVVYVTILCCALAFSSAIFFVLEFDTPLDGFIYVSSEPARDALRHLDAP